MSLCFFSLSVQACSSVPIATCTRCTLYALPKDHTVGACFLYHNGHQGDLSLCIQPNILFAVSTMDDGSDGGDKMPVQQAPLF